MYHANRNSLYFLNFKLSLSVTYAVTIVEDDIEQAAILCVTDRTVQLSVAVQATNNNAIKRNGSSVISTNVDGVGKISNFFILFILLADSQIVNIFTSCWD